MLVNKHKHGFTTVELMVTAGLVGILATIFVSYRAHSQKIESQTIAATNASTQTDELAAKIVNDIRYSTAPPANAVGFCASPFCTSLNIERYNSSANKYTIQYSNQCLPIPAKVASLVQGPIKDVAHKCFNASTCTPNQIPYIQVQSLGVTTVLPDYTQFVNGARAFKENLIGAAFCLVNNGNYTILYIDYAIYGADGKIKRNSKAITLGGNNGPNTLVFPGN